MKITKLRLKQIIKEELEKSHKMMDMEKKPEEPKTMETLLSALQGLLEEWPACEEDPGGAACQYHKDLEEVVVEYGGEGCPKGAHDEEKETET